MKPNFESVERIETKLPYRDENYSSFQFTDPMLKGYEVLLLEDSNVERVISDDSTNSRLTTIAARFPRVILSEVNTHRVFSRNSASSRARSVKTTVSSVMNDPYIPLFTKNQKGMSGVFLNEEERKKAIDLWLKARNDAVVWLISLLTGEDLSSCRENVVEDWPALLDDYYENGYPEGSGILSVHKQNANRLLEPFSWHEAIITSSYWKNFSNLRISEAAMPEIYALAVLVKAALDYSVPKTDGFHVPFIDHKEIDATNFSTLTPSLMKSATECASVSYRDKTTDSKKVESTVLGERLLKMKHLSPFEHVALSLEKYLDLADSDESLSRDSKTLNSNLDPEWIQARHIFISALETRI